MILYSRHAREQMIERGISVREVEEAITRGTKELQQPDKMLCHYKYYTVVVKRRKEDTVVITVMLR